MSAIDADMFLAKGEAAFYKTASQLTRKILKSSKFKKTYSIFYDHLWTQAFALSKFDNAKHGEFFFDFDNDSIVFQIGTQNEELHQLEKQFINEWSFHENDLEDQIKQSLFDYAQNPKFTDHETVKPFFDRNKEES